MACSLIAETTFAFTSQAGKRFFITLNYENQDMSILSASQQRDV